VHKLIILLEKKTYAKCTTAHCADKITKILSAGWPPKKPNKKKFKTKKPNKKILINEKRGLGIIAILLKQKVKKKFNF
jgi:hypothetical protein